MRFLSPILLLLTLSGALRAQIDQTDMAVDMAEAFTFTKYPSYMQYDSMMHHLANGWPEICRIDTFGTSTGGRLLLALKISDNVHTEEDEPAFLYSSTMHGDELVGFVLLLQLSAFILSNYGSNAEIDRIVDDLEVWINPNANPDGSYANNRDTSMAASTRYNLNGRDLNRDFPDPGAGDPDDTTGVQQENRYMMQFMHKHGFNLSANIHSGTEVVNYPWDHKPEEGEARVLHPDDDWYRLISREYADLAHDVDPGYMMGFDDGITNGADWYVITGGRQDYVNYYLRGREVTLELSYIKRLPSEQLEEHWNINKWSLVSYIAQARYGIHGKVTNRENGNPVPAKIWVMGHDNDSSWVQGNASHGSFYRYLKEGTYDLLVSAEGYFPDTVTGVQVADYERTVLNVQLDSLETGVPQPEPPSLLLYPNPARETLYVQSDKAFSRDGALVIMTADGRIVCAHALPEGERRHRISVSELPAGIYVVKISGGDRKMVGRFARLR
jgi:hypothetical protein